MTDQNLTINYIDAAAGSGKTTALSKFIAKNHYQKKILVIVPRQDLCKAYLELFESQGINTNIFAEYSLITDNSSVTSKIKSRIEQINQIGFGTLIVCQKGFEMLPEVDFAQKETWIDFIDEIPNAFEYFPIDISNNQEVFLKHFIHVDPEAESFYVIRKAKKTNFDLKTLDDVEKVFLPLISGLNDGRTILVGKKGFDRIMIDRERSEISEENKLHFLSFLSPDKYIGFASTYLLGANVEQSYLYHFWSKRKKIEFVKSTLFDSYLRKPKLGLDTTIVPIQEKLLAKSDLATLYDVLQKIDALFSTRYLFTSNINILENIKDDSSFQNMKVMRPLSAGLNDYIDIDHVVYLAAINHSPFYSTILEEFLALDKDQLYAGYTGNFIYQAVTRSSIRDLTNTNSNVFFVPDMIAAKFLKTLFPLAKIKTPDFYMEKVERVVSEERRKKTSATMTGKKRGPYKTKAQKQAELEFAKEEFNKIFPEAT